MMMPEGLLPSVKWYPFPIGILNFNLADPALVDSVHVNFSISRRRRNPRHGFSLKQMSSSPASRTTSRICNDRQESVVAASLMTSFHGKSGKVSNHLAVQMLPGCARFHREGKILHSEWKDGGPGGKPFLKIVFLLLTTTKRARRPHPSIWGSGILPDKRGGRDFGRLKTLAGRDA